MEFVIFWVLCGFGAMMIAQSRGGSAVLGFIVGALFGPFGLLFSFFLGGEKEKEKKMVDEGTRKKCPMCAELVQADAMICKHCKHTFEASA